MKQYVATFLFCVLFMMGMDKSAWQSSHEFHAVLETAATLLTFFVGLLALIRYFARRDLKILMLVAAFFGSAVLNAFHVFGTSGQFNLYLGGNWENLIPWTWMAERIFLALYLLAAGDTLWALRNPKLEVHNLESRSVIASIALGVASLAYFVLLPSPTVYIDGPIGRPQEVFPALFFLLAFLAFYRLGDWREEGFDLWLMHSLVLAFMGQICMSLASENFDPYFDAAHALKILSYAFVLYGLSRGIYLLYGEAAHTRGRLTEREMLLAEAQEIAHVGNWEWDVVKGEILWSQELYRIFGVDPENFEVDFDSYLNLVHPDDRPLVEEKIRLCYGEGEPYHLTHRIQSRTGEIRWLQCRGKALFDEDQHIVRLLGTAQDVTENHLNEERFRNLLEAAPDGMVITDETGAIILVNAQSEKLFGYSREELLGKPVETLMPERYRGHHVANRQGFFHSPVTRPMGMGLELFGQRKNGDEFPIEISLSPFDTPKGKMVIAAVRDVTESRTAQQALARYARELERSNAELERFAYVASHDMKEPLRKIQAFGDRLEDRYAEKLGETGSDYVHRMQDAAQRMSMLIEDMLTYSRIEIRSGAWEEVDMQSLLDNSLQNLDLVIQENRAEVIADKLPCVEGHRWQLEMLLQNLLSNSLKYRKPERSPEIRISVKEQTPKAGWVEIRLADNGIGFSSEFSEKIFQPFERLHTHKEYPGTGIGLSICRKIVEHHHGRIRALGEPGAGATFIIELPLSQASVGKHSAVERDGREPGRA